MQTFQPVVPDERIIAKLLKLPELPGTVNQVICQFQCGYWKATRCLAAAREQRGEAKKTLTMEDF